jgi:hypothetical protein
MARHAPGCLSRWRCAAPRAGDPEPVLPELYQGAVALTHSADRFSQKLMVLAKEPD